MVSATEGEANWTEACVQQADRVIVVISADVAGDVTLAEALRGCDAVLLDSAASPTVKELLDRLAPRSTHRVARTTLDADVARLARRLASRSVGLVLSGGGARGFAHIGAIEELLAAGIVIDRVGGTSMGAFIGALLATGMDGEQVDAHCYEEWVRRSPLSDFGLPRHALVRGVRLRATLERNLTGLIEDLPRSYYCTAVDILSTSWSCSAAASCPRRWPRAWPCPACCRR